VECQGQLAPCHHHCHKQTNRSPLQIGVVGNLQAMKVSSFKARTWTDKHSLADPAEKKQNCFLGCGSPLWLQRNNEWTPFQSHHCQEL